jgi:hypothetical protein
MLREGGREGERGKWIRLLVVGVGRLFLSFSESDVVGLVMWCIFVQVKDFSMMMNKCFFLVTDSHSLSYLP